MLVFPVAILIGACEACRAGGGWSWTVERGLALTGLGIGALSGAFAFAARRRPGLAETNDALTVLLALGGVALAVGASATGALPCPFCLAFWACAFGLFVELLVSDRRLGPWAVRAGLVGALSAIVLGWTPRARGALAALLPAVEPAPLGPPVGSRLPESLRLPEVGLVAFVTECPVCWANTLRDRLTSLSRDGRTVTLVATDRSQALVREFPRLPYRIVAPGVFQSFGLRTKGAPYFVAVTQGRVQWSKPASTFEPKEATR